ncbi:MAG TPA: serine hydrolase domain-containing protein [Thermomicrobiales bacterium]|nr:serine hydrolase domain-containing protein [Thermomicrobiales bacterium]
MSTLDQAKLQTLLDETARKTGVPGSAVAVLHRGVLTEAATGVTNLRTNVATTTDTLFQIGSISKLWTAVLVLELVDEGIVGLDDPVQKHLPEFQVADADVSATITLRHLLTHSGGFDGDYFTDTGRGSDAIAQFVAQLHTSEQFFAPGKMFAYNNAGWVVLGRLIEVLREQDFHSVVRERLYAPLGLEFTATLPEEALLYRTAVGHVRGAEDEGWIPAPVWSLPHSTAPTGAALTMSAGSLATFATMLAHDGVAENGTRILSPDIARLLHRHHATLPVQGFIGDRFGHGAFLYDYEGGTAFGHDGQTIGQTAYLRVLPDHDLVIVVMTNRESPIVLFETIVGYVLETLTPVRLIPVPEAPTPQHVEATLIVGSYANNSLTAEVTIDDTGQAYVQLGSPNLPMGNQPPLAIAALNRYTYLSQVKGDAPAIPFHFIDTDNSGTADFLSFVRLLRRV